MSPGDLIIVLRDGTYFPWQECNWEVDSGDIGIFISDNPCDHEFYEALIGGHMGLLNDDEFRVLESLSEEADAG